MTTSKDKTIEILGQERRRRWSTEEKLAVVREIRDPGQTHAVLVRQQWL
jgi:transposase